jgi:hypothetical protein
LHGNQWKSFRNGGVAMVMRSTLLGLFLASLVLGSSSEKPEFKLDLSGQWKWTMQRQNGGGREITLTLKQDGEKLTGTVSGLGFGGESDIEEGSYKDGQVTFKVTRSRGGQDITTTYTGKVQGDTIKGMVDTDIRGNKVPRDWEAHRVKDDSQKPEN